MVVVGTHSLPQTYQTAHRIRLALGEAGRHTLFDEFWLVNMVYNTRVDTDHGIDIASIYKNNLDKTEWVPPMFPGLKYSMEEEHVKLRIFDTRAVVVMGATRPARINTIFRKVTDMATKNPDYYLPDTDERYAYREAKVRYYPFVFFLPVLCDSRPHKISAPGSVPRQGDDVSGGYGDWRRTHANG